MFLDVLRSHLLDIHLRGMFPNSHPTWLHNFLSKVSLKALTLRAVTPCPLISAQREQTLCSLDNKIVYL